MFTVVADDAAMESIFFGEENLLDEAAGTLFMNCATLTPSIHVKVDSGAKLAGAHCLEGCLALSIPRARNGELLLVISGDQPVFNDK